MSKSRRPKLFPRRFPKYCNWRQGREGERRQGSGDLEEVRSPRAVGDGADGLGNLRYGRSRRDLVMRRCRCGGSRHRRGLLTEQVRIIWQQTRGTGIMLQWESGRGREDAAGPAGGGAFEPSSQPPRTASLAQFRGRCRLAHESRYKTQTPTNHRP